MLDKRVARKRRAKKGRAKLNSLGAVRLTVFKSSNNIYAQIIEAKTSKILAQASSLDKTMKGATGGNITAAIKVGTLVAERAKQSGIEKVALDRSGYKYHGRIRALADAAREGGLQF